MKKTIVVLLFLFASCLQAYDQQREFGMLAGASFLNGLPLQGAGAVTAGFTPGPTAGVLMGHDLYSRWSGEIRYLFEIQDARLRSPATAATFGSQSHAVHYAVVYHARPRQARLRPYLEVGGGAKIFRGTGTEVAYRPLMQYAYLTQTQELKPMAVFGGGIKLRLSPRVQARIDILDYLTRFPQKVIAPAPGVGLSGWLHNFVPTVGIGWMF